MNAYYFVDVVAESPAPIYFVADSGSDLGNPVVIANAGEANRVPLLIGLEYTVTSSVPFSGGGCGCVGSGGGPGHSETNSVTPELSLSMCLDHDVILFENAYTNRPGEIVARRSTFVCVQLAYGNASGSEANLMLTVPKGADDVLLHEDGTNGNVVTSWYANLP